jgi:hypothetical protein
MTKRLALLGHKKPGALGRDESQKLYRERWLKSFGGIEIPDHRD